MPLQRAILERFPYYSNISNLRTLKRHECRDPSRSARNFVTRPEPAARRLNNILDR